jgi:hypothetical protein
MTVRDHMTLLLAGAHYANEGRRVAAMGYAELGYSETRFWARVNRLLDLPEAEREHPEIVRRLRRLREARRGVRVA